MSVFTNRSLLKKGFETLRLRLGHKLSVETQQKRLYNLTVPSDSKNHLNIWYTGENIRPPVDNRWDALLTFETDDSISKNIYLPFWVTRLGETLEKAESRQKVLLSPRTEFERRDGFACAVISNPEPTRMRALEELKKIGQVGLYGSVFNNPIENKFEILNKYTFNLCFENDLYPGYVTEKVFEAWSAGSIPIWWGIDAGGFINENAVINFATLGFQGGIQRVRELLASPQKLRLMQREPILKKGYDFLSLQKKLHDLLNGN